MLALLSALALAHPGAFRVADHDLAVTVTPEAVALDYRLSIPRLHRHGGRPPSVDPQAPDGTEILSGFRVLVDDAPVSIDLTETPTHTRSATADHIAVNLSAPVDLTEGPHTVRVENGNFPDMAGLYRTAWFVAEGLVVHGGDRLVQADDGTWTDRSAVWSPREADRVGWLAVSVPSSTGASIVPAIDAVPQPTAHRGLAVAVVAGLLAIAGAIGWRVRIG